MLPRSLLLQDPIACLVPPWASPGVLHGAGSSESLCRVLRRLLLRCWSLALSIATGSPAVSTQIYLLLHGIASGPTWRNLMKGWSRWTVRTRAASHLFPTLSQCPAAGSDLGVESLRLEKTSKMIRSNHQPGHGPGAFSSSGALSGER